MTDSATLTRNEVSPEMAERKHAPLPYETVEIGAHTASAGCHIYLTDVTGRKVAVVWGKANEKAFTAHLIKRAVNSHHTLVAALEAALRIADEARKEWDRAPSTMKAGKLLIALTDPTLRYRADITAIHDALAAAKEGA